ncbi:hypothetical protein [Aureimonas sp. ME7]|uniref:hypothetical protein n=1 Tax=Aureimonas sp. ME7 TaxID=2744252 RepID=UPI0015F51217|nr:hypothetical protein [Aureimonas sp. ME7]
MQTTPRELLHPQDASIERIAASGDVGALAAALQLLKQATRAQHAESMAVRYADRLRYAVSDDWSHYFSDVAPEFDTRWVFDRHEWRVAVLHVKRRSDVDWFLALPDETEDVTESLVDANAGALDHAMDEFGVYEANALPNWVSEAIKVERRALVEAAE